MCLLAELFLQQLESGGEKCVCVSWWIAWVGSYESWPPHAILTPLLLKLLQGGLIRWWGRNAIIILTRNPIVRSESIIKSIYDRGVWIKSGSEDILIASLCVPMSGLDHLALTITHYTHLVLLCITSETVAIIPVLKGGCTQGNHLNWNLPE